MGRQVRAMAVSPFVRQRLGTWFVAGENSTDLDALRGMIEAGELEPVVSAVVELRDVPGAMRDLAAGRVQGKVVVVTP